ncbi:MAG: MBL fold metallo-hydrolase [Bacillota bacterium]
MSKTIVFILAAITAIAVFAGGLYAFTSIKQGSNKSVSYENMLKGVEHYVNSTVKINKSKVIYIDPYLIKGEPVDADIVFVTHTHFDHFSIQDIKKVMKEDATLVVTTDGVKAAKKAGIKDIVEVEPMKEYKAKGIEFETVPAYNTSHSKSKKWVGYIIKVDNIRYYAAGDTDNIPEMSTIKCDVAFLPVGGNYTMSAKDALDAVNIIKPFIAVPVHFGEVAGTYKDAEEFVNGLGEDIRGALLQKQ